MKEEVELILATVDDAELIQEMKYMAFMPLYEKYHDDETTPVNETIDKVINHLSSRNSQYYLIKLKGENIGAIRIARKLKKKQMAETVVADGRGGNHGGNPEDGKVEYVQGVLYISPLFILPEYQNSGLGQTAIRKAFELYPDAVTWKLETIKQEEGNCHLYKKCGFVRVDGEHVVNENMTLVGYEKTNVNIRRFKDEDAETVSSLLARNFIEVNSRDYGLEAMEKLAAHHNADWVRQIADESHMYVFERREKIVGVGSIAAFWGSETESILLTVFVLPELHGKGIGRTIMKALEADEYFTRAGRIEIPASITATEFYRKFGYDYKKGVKELDEEGHYRLEKFKEAQ